MKLKYIIPIVFLGIFVSSFFIFDYIKKSKYELFLAKEGFEIEQLPYKRAVYHNTKLDYYLQIPLEKGAKTSNEYGSYQIDYYNLDNYDKMPIKLIVNKNHFSGEFVLSDKSRCSIEIIDGIITNTDPSNFCQDVFSNEMFLNDKNIYENAIIESSKWV